MKKLFVLMLVSVSIISCNGSNKNSSNNDVAVDTLDSLGQEENDSLIKAMLVTPGYMGQLMEKAHQGNAYAQNVLATCYFNGWQKSQDYHEAFSWYRKAANQGHPRAQINLGNCYLYGYGVQQNNEKAFYWYKQSADQGYADGLNCLGECYVKEIGVLYDEKKAVDLFKKSASLGSPGGKGNLGQAYFLGVGVEKNLEKSIKLMEEAAKQGQNVYYGLLGSAYYQLKRYGKAVYYLQLAAEQGDAESQKMLGDCYYYGIGVNKDENVAKKWYDNAAGLGDSPYSSDANISIETMDNDTYEEESSTKPSKIPFTFTEGKYRINCRVNGSPTFFILKPSSSGITISQKEATSWFKKGVIAQEDVDGETKFIDSNGIVKDGTTFKLRELRFSDILLRYEKVKVVSSQSDGLIVGVNVIEELGNLEYDINHKVITLKYLSDYY